MKKLREYAIGNLLEHTDDVFEKARIILIYQFSIVFLFIFALPLLTDILLHYYKALVIHSFDFVILFFFPYLLRKTKKLDNLINLFFSICALTSLVIFMTLNPDKMEPVGAAWFVVFMILSALMQKGKARILFICFLLWIPVAYVFINQMLHGQITIPFIAEVKTQDPPLPVIMIPVFIGTYAIWFHTRTIQIAKETITQQKELIEEKNKDITDSITYAKHIQVSLLPTEKYIAQTLKRLNKSAGS
jgi:hypothetical protein